MIERQSYLPLIFLTKYLSVSTSPLLHKLLVFDMTLHRLKFLSSDEYIFVFS